MIMAISDNTRQNAEHRMAAERDHAHAVDAWYDSRTQRVIVRLQTGLELSIMPDMVQGLSYASPEALSDIEISPSGLGLHWPKLDADVYVPSLL